MAHEDFADQLRGAGFTIDVQERLTNNLGDQFRLRGGLILNIFDKGTLTFQGKRDANNEAVISELYTRAAHGPHPSNAVFIVYGHDEPAKQSLENMLRKWGIEPMFLDQLPSEGQTIIEKLEKYQAQASFAIVLATPDDEGHRAGKPDENAYRTRQNVVLELGMMLSKLGRQRVAILLKDQGNMEKPSDIQGLIYIPFKDDVADARVQLAKEMHAQGFHIPMEKL